MKLILFVLSFSLFASENVDYFRCQSGEVSIFGKKQDCEDPRYVHWQKNGCYLVKVDSPENSFEIEMVRNIRYELEERQKFYSFFTYDEKEYVLEGLLMEIKSLLPINQVPRMRFDQRENNKQKFKSIHGLCLSNH